MQTQTSLTKFCTEKHRLRCHCLHRYARHCLSAMGNQYTIYGYEYDEIHDCEYDGLLSFGIKKQRSPYHDLYRYPHSCSRIVNHSVKNGKRLFVSGDSQILPSVPMLSCYFEEVLYSDNRTGQLGFHFNGLLLDYNTTRSFKQFYDEIDFTHALFALYSKPINYYTEINLK